MQRSITLIIAALVVLLMAGGAGAYFYKMNQPEVLWIPIPRNAVAENEIKTYLQKSEVLSKISANAGVPVELISRGMYFEQGQFTDPKTNGIVESFNIGLRAKRKNRTELRNAIDSIGKELQSHFAPPAEKSSPTF